MVSTIARLGLLPVATVVSPDGRNLYAAANSYGNLIAAFSRASDGSLVPVKGHGGCILPLTPTCERPVDSQRQLSGLAASPDSRNLYSLADYRPIESVQAFVRVVGGGLRNATAGVSCAGAKGVDVADRRHKCQFDRNLGGGGRPGLAGAPRALAFSPEGHEIYIALADGIVTVQRTASGGVYSPLA